MWDHVFLDDWYEIDVGWNDGSSDNPYWMLTHDEMAKMHMGACFDKKPMNITTSKYEPLPDRSKYANTLLLQNRILFILC